MNTDRHVWRGLDVNINRASEALRVLEDIARLHQEDLASALQLKELRHSLTAIVRRLDRAELLAARSTEHDPGTQVTNDQEQCRPTTGAIVSAEVTRIGQSLRCLEEFSKLVDASISQQFKALRYQAYDQLARIELAWTQHAWLKSLRLCILIDCQLPIDRFADYLTSLCDAGSNCIQIRDKQCDGRRLVEYARRAVTVLDRYAGHVVVNDRVDVALASGAAAVHVGQDDLSIHDVRRIAGWRLAVGLSTHSIEQARQAVELGADYIGCGPSFPSQTKHFQEFPGTNYLRQVASEISLPSLAIGGVNLETLEQVLETGVRGVAVTAAIHGANEPTQAVRAFCRRLSENV